MNREDFIHRIRTAIILLNEGNSINVGDLTFNAKNKKHLSITGWSTKISLEEINQQDSLLELREIKELFNKMVKSSSDLSEFTNGRQIEYKLNFDSGKSSIEICNEIEGKLTWIFKSV